jgi:hypothetical protein
MCHFSRIADVANSEETTRFVPNSIGREVIAWAQARLRHENTKQSEKKRKEKKNEKK